MAATYPWKWLRGEKLTVKFDNAATALGITYSPVLVSSNLIGVPTQGCELLGVAIPSAAASETYVPIIVSDDVFEVQVKSGTNLGLGDKVQVEADGSVDALGAANNCAGAVVDYNPAASGIAHIKATFTTLGGANIGDVRSADIADGAITNAKLATDVKVGSLATLTTTEKASVVGAINEIDAAAGASVLATLDDTTDEAAGADMIGVTTIAGATGNTVQHVLEWLIALLQAETNGAAGADFVAITPITSYGAADTVQECLEAIDTLLKAVTDSAAGADYIGMTATATTGAAATVQSVIEALIAVLKAVTDSSSGADLIGMTVITETGANATVQSVIEALITRLKAVADSSSGADLIGLTTIAGVTGTTVQAGLEWLCARLQDETNSASGADFVAITPITALGAADTVQEGLEAFDALLASVTNSASGADYIGMTAITQTGAAATVQSVIEALITALVAETDSASGADLVACTPIPTLGAADTVQEALEALDAQKIRGSVICIPVSDLKNVTNTDKLIDGYVPGFAGKIGKLSFITGDVPVTTPAKDIDVQCYIGAVPTTGGLLTLLSANASSKGEVTNATAISAANSFSATDAISLTCVEETAVHTEGNGTFVITLYAV
jgi:hypothetical protein